MRIPEEAIDEFVDIYKAEFDEDLSREDAAEISLRLLRPYTSYFHECYQMT
jgi:hypothetical protein